MIAVPHDHGTQTLMVSTVSDASSRTCVDVAVALRSRLGVNACACAHCATLACGCARLCVCARTCGSHSRKAVAISATQRYAEEQVDAEATIGTVIVEAASRFCMSVLYSRVSVCVCVCVCLYVWLCLAVYAGLYRKESHALDHR